MKVDEILLMDPKSTIRVNVASLQGLIAELSILKNANDWSSTCAHILKSELEELKRAHAELIEELDNALANNSDDVIDIDFDLDDL